MRPLKNRPHERDGEDAQTYPEDLDVTRDCAQVGGMDVNG